MVSFQCEGCGDVLTKKKLDPHRGQCRGASYTCIDCMVHFQGTEYRSHTSCMTEAQKYQGALYKEKPTKGQKKAQNAQNNQNKNCKTNPNANKQARVEDGSDGEHLINRPPPPAPTPPPAGAVKTPKPVNGKAVNVFDYLVTDETPNASKVSLAGPKEQMTMVSHAKSVFEPSKTLAHLDSKTDSEGNYDISYEENGFSYGNETIPPTKAHEVVTPAPKKKKKEKKDKGSEKKRKRDQPESFNSPEPEDTPMMDAPSSIINNAGTPMLNHSGLTGGLSRMMRSPSIDDSSDHGRHTYQETSSPIKKTRRTTKENSDGLGISIRNRAERLVSSMFSGTGSVASNGSANHESSRAVVRRGSLSSGDDQLEIRKRKSHRSRAVSDNNTERKSKRKSSNPTDDRPSRRQKHADERSSHRDSRQVTIYRHSEAPARREDIIQRDMAQHFLSLVSDGERGCSIHKALKRFHRDFDDYDADPERRNEDERDLWRGLRLRRNDRGEIVVTI